MDFEKWFDAQIDKELSKNPELKKVFDESPEKRELYKQKLLNSEPSTNNSFRMRYLEEQNKK